MEAKELFIRAQKGDKEAKEQLFKDNMGLVHHVIKRYVNRVEIEKEDCFRLARWDLSKQLKSLI